MLHMLVEFYVFLDVCYSFFYSEINKGKEAENHKSEGSIYTMDLAAHTTLLV